MISVLNRATSRLTQGLRALSAWTRVVDVDLAARILSPGELALFERMRRSEKLHSLNVLRALQQNGVTNPALLKAALLHDCGKVRAPYFLWDRVLVVLLAALVPLQVEKWGQHAPRGVYRPFAVLVQHPTWGAQLAQQAGSDPLTVDLIAHHAEKHGDAEQNAHNIDSTQSYQFLLPILQAADDAN